MMYLLSEAFQGQLKRVDVAACNGLLHLAGHELHASYLSDGCSEAGGTFAVFGGACVSCSVSKTHLEVLLWHIEKRRRKSPGDRCCGTGGDSAFFSRILSY